MDHSVSCLPCLPRSGQGAPGQGLFQSLTASREFRDDRLYGSGPDERFRLLVPGSEELIDCLLQVSDAVEGTPANSLAGQFAEPSLDQIQPAGTGRHEMANKAGMAFQPGLHVGMLVRAVVVHDEMQRHLAGKLLVQPPEEPDELLVAMSLMALSDDTPLQHLQ